jgi:hypothetical protein
MPRHGALEPEPHQAEQAEPEADEHGTVSEAARGGADERQHVVDRGYRQENDGHPLALGTHQQRQFKIYCLVAVLLVSAAVGSFISLYSRDGPDEPEPEPEPTPQPAPPPTPAPARSCPIAGWPHGHVHLAGENCPKNILDGSTIPDASNANTCNLECSPGYNNMDRSVTLSCSNGNLSQNGMCNERAECPKTQPLHSVTNCTGLKLNDVCTIKCERGYTATGQCHNLTCQPINAALMGFPTKDDKCKPVVCPITPLTFDAHAHGGCTNHSIHFSEACEIQCDPGWVSKNGDGMYGSYTCQADKSFQITHTHTNLQCERVPCDWDLKTEFEYSSDRTQSNQVNVSALKCDRSMRYVFEDSCTSDNVCGPSPTVFTCQDNGRFIWHSRWAKCPNIRDGGGGPVLLRALTNLALDLSDGSTVYLQPDARFISPPNRDGWFQDDTEFVKVTVRDPADDAPPVHVTIRPACDQTVNCPLNHPPCGMNGCCSLSSLQCSCTGKWVGQTCSRRHWSDWPASLQVMWRYALVLVAFAVTSKVCMSRVNGATSWHDSHGMEHLLDAGTGSLLQQTLQLFVFIEYLQIGGVAFRQAVPWTAVDLSNMMSLRSCLAAVHIVFRVVLFEYQPGFLAQFWILLTFMCILSVLGVRRWFAAQDPNWKSRLKKRTTFVAIASPGFGLWSVLNAFSTEHPTGSLVLFVPFAAVSLVAVTIRLVLTREGSRDSVSLVDLFIQIVLPEILLPVVRRLFAPLAGCIFYHETEHSPCGTSACLARLITLSCSFHKPLYVWLFTAGTILLVPAWTAILHAMVTYQAHMENGRRQPRWPLLPWYAFYHGQMKVALAIMADCFRDHPLVMLLGLFGGSLAELVLVAVYKPHQHMQLNRYRLHGATFAVWSCVCAFLALAIDDRTDSTSIAVFCAGYAAYQLVALCVPWEGYAAVARKLGRVVSALSIVAATIALLQFHFFKTSSGDLGAATALCTVAIIASILFCTCDHLVGRRARVNRRATGPLLLHSAQGIELAPTQSQASDGTKFLV